MEEGQIYTAKKWLLKAAEQEYTTAQYQLSTLLQKEENIKEANKWHSRATQHEINKIRQHLHVSDSSCSNTQP